MFVSLTLKSPDKGVVKCIFMYVSSSFHPSFSSPYALPGRLPRRYAAQSNHSPTHSSAFGGRHKTQVRESVFNAERQDILSGIIMIWMVVNVFVVACPRVWNKDDLLMTCIYFHDLSIICAHFFRSRPATSLGGLLGEASSKRFSNILNYSVPGHGISGLHYIRHKINVKELFVPIRGDFQGSFYNTATPPNMVTIRLASNLSDLFLTPSCNV